MSGLIESHIKPGEAFKLRRGDCLSFRPDFCEMRVIRPSREGLLEVKKIKLDGLTREAFPRLAKLIAGFSGFDTRESYRELSGQIVFDLVVR